MYRTIAALIAEGARRGARPRNDAAAVDKGNSMSSLDTSPNEGTDRDESARQEPNGHGIGLWAHDVSGGGEGEMLAVYSPDRGGQMDGEILYARPRVCVDLEAHR